MKLANSRTDELMGCEVVVKYNKRRNSRKQEDNQKCTEEEFNKVAQKYALHTNTITYNLNFFAMIYILDMKLLAFLNVVSYFFNIFMKMWVNLGSVWILVNDL